MCTGAAAVAFTSVALDRWAAYETNAFDLAFFDQIIWNTAQGRPLATSFVAYNFAGQHFEPVLLFFVPAYWLGAGPQLLLATQALVSAAAALPLFALARRFGLPLAAAVAAALAFLANPYLHGALGFDFHPEVMAAGPAFAAAWAATAGRGKLAIAFALSTLLFKEDAVFIAVALAAFMYRRGLHTEAKTVAGASIAYAAVVVLVFMPLIRHGQPSDLVERYGHFLPSGGGLEFLSGLALAPVRALRVALAPAQLLTLGAFAVISAPLLLLAPRRLVWLLPSLGLAVLSTHPEQRGLQLHYTVEAVPIALILAVEAAAQFRHRIAGPVLAVGLAGPALLACIALNPLGASRGEMPSPEHREALAAAIALVPSDGSVAVSAQSGLLPRLSHREQAHEFPGAARTASWVLVDQYGFRSSQSIGAGFFDELAVVRETMDRVFAADGVELYRRRP